MDDSKSGALFKPCLREFWLLARFPDADLGPVDLRALQRFARLLRWLIVKRQNRLHRLLNNCDNNIMGVRNQVLLRLGYETMRRRSELCTFKFEDICQAPSGKPAIRLNFSKTDQFGTGKILPISQELFDLLENWRNVINDEGYILRSISRHGHIGENLHPASISTLLKALQKDLKMDSDEQPLSGHSFRVGAALDLLEQGEPLEKIML